jgi:hypothetical protein
MPSPITVMSNAARKRRIDRLVLQLTGLELSMRAAAAALLELTEPDDDLHVEVVRLLQALEG